MRPQDDPGVAETVADVTPDWLAASLAGPLGPVRVAEVVATRVGTGQVGATYRLDVTYAGDVRGPSPIIVKLAAEDPSGRAAVAPGYRAEVGFYTELAATVDVRTPSCWYGAIADDGSTFTLLLDDLAPAQPGVQAQGCSVEQAMAAVRNIAGLHAPRWADPSLREIAFLAGFDAAGADAVGEVLGPATEQFVGRYEDRLGVDDVAVLRDSADAIASWLKLDDGPASLVHGDYRLDNLMFHPDGSVAALDWQTLSVGPPARDVAYFLGTSLEPTLRRDHEQSIVGAYHTELLSRSVSGYDAPRCFRDYRLGQLQGPLITILGSEFATAHRTPEADAMFVAMATRSCAAIRELDSLALLDAAR